MSTDIFQNMGATPQTSSGRTIGPTPNMGNMGSFGLTRDGTTADTVPIGVLPDVSSFKLVAGCNFPRGYWAPELFAQTLLAEFGTTDWMTSIQLSAPNDSPAALEADIADMLRSANAFRDQRMSELMAQSVDPLCYWGDALMIKPGSSSPTWTLIASAVAVGQMVAMHFKRIFNRARPVQVFPGLMPLAPTPRHPSYPNSHALQAQLITLCLTEVVPVEMIAPLQQLADRIGKNREIAGFHFPSDTEASLKLAPQVYESLKKGKLFTDLIIDARREWLASGGAALAS